MRRIAKLNKPLANRIVGHGEEAVDQLLANPLNFRLHPDNQQQALAGAIDDIGFIRSVTVNQRTGRVVDGHLRVTIAARSGVETLPVEDVEPQIDKAEELRVKWGVESGQLWQLGEHRLICGDCTDKAVVERVMGGERADCVLTDPPYGMNLDTDFSGMVGIGAGNKYNSVIGDDTQYDPSHIFRDFDYCKEVFLWGADYYAELIPNRVNGSWIVWDKMGGGNGVNDDYDKMFGSNFELCWSKTKHKRAIARVLWKGIFGLNKEPEHKRFHPTQKPVDLSVWILEKFTVSQNIVVDLFLGAASLLLACERLGRKCRAVEISPAYVAVAIQRWADVTGKEPVLIDRVNTIKNG